MRRFLNRETLVLVLGCVVAVNTCLIAWTLLRAAGERRELCGRVEVVKARIYTSIEDGLVSLPDISYYRRHPDELAIQVRKGRQQLRAFAPSDC